MKPRRMRKLGPAPSVGFFERNARERWQRVSVEHANSLESFVRFASEERPSSSLFSFTELFCILQNYSVAYRIILCTEFCTEQHFLSPNYSVDHRIILYSAELFCSLPNYSVHRIIWPPYQFKWTIFTICFCSTPYPEWNTGKNLREREFSVWNFRKFNSIMNLKKIQKSRFSISLCFNLIWIRSCDLWKWSHPHGYDP